MSRLSLGPGQKMAFVPGPMASRASGGIGAPFVPVGGSTRDKRPLSPRSFGPGTKATFCPGSKSSRDKWSGTKVCSVVVTEMWKGEIYLQSGGEKFCSTQICSSGIPLLVSSIKSFLTSSFCSRHFISTNMRCFDAKDNCSAGPSVLTTG